MSTDRRPYRREPEEARREALIEAALELVALGGPQAATVRAIAARAGVTPGLIRHYFATKEELTRAAYRRFVQMLTDHSTAALRDAGPSPTARLAAFVAASASGIAWPKARLASKSLIWAMGTTVVTRAILDRTGFRWHSV